MVGESTTDERTDDACKGENTTKGTEENWTIFETSDLTDDSENGDEDARGADTLNGTTKDEDIDGGADTTNETAELEEEDCDEVEVFSFRDSEELTKGEHEPCLCD